MGCSTNSVMPLSRDKPDQTAIRLLINLRKPVLIKLKLEPDDKTREKWQESFKYDPKNPEECWVFWNGVTFVACTFCKKEASLYFGHKARDTLENLFKQSELLYCSCIGPSPIHSDIIMPIFLKEAIKENTSINKIG